MLHTVALNAPIDLNLLSQFVRVAESSSFSTAATKLGVRRSSVSRAIASLERSLGVQLFNRTTRTVALTTAGTALYAKIAPQLAAVRESVTSLPERDEGPSGELRVTAPNDFGAVILAPLLSGFMLRYPAVTLDVRLTNRRVDLVAEGFDAALRVTAGRLSDSSLLARRLSSLEMHVYAAPTYLARAGTPRSAREAADHAWVSMPALKLPRPLPTPTVKPRLLSDDVFFVAQAVSAGAGLSLLPTFLVREELATGRLVRVLPRISVRTGALHFVHPPTQHVPRKVTAFQDYLVAHFAAHPLSTRQSGLPR